MASHAIDGPYKRSWTAWRILSWSIFWACFITLALFTTYARAESLTVFGGPQAPVEGWTSGHKYHTLGIGIYHTFYSSDKIELEAGLVYQQYMNGITGRTFAMDLMLTSITRPTKAYIGFNAGFGYMWPQQFEDIGDIPCSLAGHFGPIVGYSLTNRASIELRLDHLSAFTPKDKGRNHMVIGLKWRF